MDESLLRYLTSACTSLLYLEKTAAKRRHSVVTAVPPAALSSVMREGLLSTQEMLKRPDLLALARANPEDRKSWLHRHTNPANGSDVQRGPSVFFSPPPKGKITEEHYIRKWGLVPLRVDLDRLRRDDPSLRVLGVELPGKQRRRDLTAEEVDKYRRTPVRELWKDYGDTRYYAADVPHAALITSSGRIPPKYLRRIGAGKR